jgi:uridine phosphorylase
MPFPNHKKKFQSKEIFTAKDWNRTRKHTKNYSFPNKYILAYFDYSLNYFIRAHKCKRIKLYSWLTIYIHKDIGFVKMASGGAPNAAAVLEELIAVGGKYFINTGTAGGLQKTGIIGCTKALRDEGTSHHYVKKGKYAFPDMELTKKLESKLKEKKLQYSTGPSWTNDALYRETFAEVETYKKEGILTVEMEASAIFTVAKFRKVKAAAIFIVSDILGHKKHTKFHRFDTKKGQRQIIDAAYDCLKEIE